MPAYKQEQELKDVAESIINTHRQILKMLKIAYIFRDEASVTDGRVVAGRAIRVDDRNWTLHKFDFIIEIAKDVWMEAVPDFRIALMDHELGHVGIKMQEDGTPGMDEKTLRVKTYGKMHDIEEFEDVLQRHGAYHKKLREFLDAFAKHKAKKSKKDGDGG